MKFNELKAYKEFFKNSEFNSLWIKKMEITSLKGCPEFVNGYFDCSYNQLTSLLYSPKKISGGFNCSNNILKTLEGSPKKIKGSFNCSDNQLTSLKYSPNRCHSFDCSNNKKVKNQIEEIIKNQIVARYYITDEGNFTFKDIKNFYIKKKKLNIKNNDYGLSI